MLSLEPEAVIRNRSQATAGSVGVEWVHVVAVSSNLLKRRYRQETGCVGVKMLL